MKVKHDTLSEQYDFVDGEYIDKVKAKYAPGIGLFLIHFSSLEHALDLCIADFLHGGSHHFGYLVIEGISLNSKIELFRKFFPKSFTNPKVFRKLSALVKHLHSVRIFRNYLAHANWSTLENTGYVRTKVDEKDGEVIFKKVRITPEVLRAWINRVKKLEEQLSEFLESAERA